jgi:hypothetical protein
MGWDLFGGRRGPAALAWACWFSYTDGMSTRELILLSPYRLPTQDALYLADDDVAAFLNGYLCLWHPAAVLGTSGPPCIASPYDHEQPTAGRLYAVPSQPPLLLPEDWRERVRSAGAIAFEAVPDRAATLANLRGALRAHAPEEPGRLNLMDSQAAPFLGIGFGYGHIDALFEAMSHEKLLDVAGLWQDVQQAVLALNDPDPQAHRKHLQAAADKLLAAREVLYPVTIHVVDLCLGDAGRLDRPWPAADGVLPWNLIASAALLQQLKQRFPERLTALRDRLASDMLEVCGGCALEREDALLPVESQLWNLLKGQSLYEDLLGQAVRVYARRRFAFHPQLPLFLQSAGIGRALLLSFDDSVVPAHRSTVINWPSQDGKQVEAFARTPHAVESPQVGFHLAHHLHRTIMQDQAATLALLHRDKSTAAWYGDWLELSRFAPVLGRWTTLSGYFNEVLSGEYTSAADADEFHDDYLVERTPSAETQGEGQPAPAASEWKGSDPISGFASQVRARRRLDTAWTLAAIHRGLTGRVIGEGDTLEARLARLEDRLEAEKPLPLEEVGKLHDEAAHALAARLVARGAQQPGYLILNPCSFKRRVVLELPGMTDLLPLTDPVKACQLDGTTGRMVLEVPALGFAWIPQKGVPGTTALPRRMRLADERTVRNEFFEAEIDHTTGGLRAIRDQRTRVNRVGQQLVYNPGSSVRVEKIQATSTGPALGEIVTEGVILDGGDQVLARFRQRFQAWVGRPILEMRIEIEPVQMPHGYPWHAYFGARFAWRDERALLLRGVNGTGYVTSHTRPVTPDYLELRSGAQNTVIFPGGLPFHQRSGGRMLDVLLLPEGETCRTFDIGISLDRPAPMQTAQGVVTPVPVVATTQGPPHVGATGWLFHLDASNLLLTSLRPSPDGGDAVVARLLECGGQGGAAELRTIRDPKRALLLDARGTTLYDVATQGDACLLDVARHDLLHLRVEFS